MGERVGAQWWNGALREISCKIIAVKKLSPFKLSFAAVSGLLAMSTILYCFKQIWNFSHKWSHAFFVYLVGLTYCQNTIESGRPTSFVYFYPENVFLCQISIHTLSYSTSRDWTLEENKSFTRKTIFRIIWMQIMRGTKSSFRMFGLVIKRIRNFFSSLVDKFQYW